MRARSMLLDTPLLYRVLRAPSVVRRAFTPVRGYTLCRAPKGESISGRAAQRRCVDGMGPTLACRQSPTISASRATARRPFNRPSGVVRELGSDHPPPPFAPVSAVRRLTQMESCSPQ